MSVGKNLTSTQESSSASPAF